METARVGVRADALPWAHLRLPPFPQVALRVLQLVHEENVGFPQLCNLISTDAAFASEILTVANSAAYSPRYPSSSVLQAITVLGARTLQGMCIMVGVRAYLGKAMAEPALRRLWRHNLACALIAERMATKGSLDKNIAYTAGVLHDLGRVALGVVRPKAYASLLDEYRGPAEGILEAERALFGMDHCETGWQLAEDWKLPEVLVPAVAEHHGTRRRDEPWNVAEMIKVSCKMADAVGFPAFLGCEVVDYGAVLKDLPGEEKALFSDDAAILSTELAVGIELIERV